jgi:4a-hydroxytetrahydrobiopterin dehydratase
MTEALACKTCTPCRGGIPPLTREQAELFHAPAPDWQLTEEAHRIERSFRFRNFRQALTFVQEIGERKLKAHHPNISFGWGNATVSLQTKKIKGLHESYQEVPSAKLMCIEARSETLKLRRIWRLVFHALARGIIAGALGDTQTPAIPKSRCQNHRRRTGNRQTRP